MWGRTEAGATIFRITQGECMALPFRSPTTPSPGEPPMMPGSPPPPNSGMCVSPKNLNVWHLLRKEVVDTMLVERACGEGGGKAVGWNSGVQEPGKRAYEPSREGVERSPAQEVNRRTRATSPSSFKPEVFLPPALRRPLARVCTLSRGRVERRGGHMRATQPLSGGGGRT
ncbi:hypothetical protein DM02DRAFT_365408 [Periconia macrospinosa]|uniref:Uncharacterized protein n=1 Tax=Periconia macrospinosa TaxID=97972 RepID=A0A2V1DSA2_9PLEO|nr:hypothetical protein DM02DRAFT_365408 [Periconia macrospinosa]